MYLSVFTFNILDDIELPNKYDIRKLFDETKNFNNFLNITNEEILRVIHLNYRLIFFKDSIAARWLDEIMINSIISDNYKIILEYFYNDDSLPDKIMKRIKPGSDFITQSTGIKFLLEIFNISFLSISELKDKFFNSFIEKDILSCLINLIQTSSEDIKENYNPSYSCLSPSFTSNHGVNSAEIFKVWTAELLIIILQAVPSKLFIILTSEETNEMGHQLLIE